VLATGAALSGKPLDKTGSICARCWCQNRCRNSRRRIDATSISYGDLINCCAEHVVGERIDLVTTFELMATKQFVHEVCGVNIEGSATRRIEDGLRLRRSTLLTGDTLSFSRNG